MHSGVPPHRMAVGAPPACFAPPSRTRSPAGPRSTKPTSSCPRLRTSRSTRSCASQPNSLTEQRDRKPTPAHERSRDRRRPIRHDPQRRHGPPVIYGATVNVSQPSLVDTACSDTRCNARHFPLAGRVSHPLGDRQRRRLLRRPDRPQLDHGGSWARCAVRFLVRERRRCRKRRQHRRRAERRPSHNPS